MAGEECTSLPASTARITRLHWNRLPRALRHDSAIHRTFQRWGAWVLERIWSMFIEECAELGGVEWEWQSADYALCEAGVGGIR